MLGRDLHPVNLGLQGPARSPDSPPLPTAPSLTDAAMYNSSGAPSTAPSAPATYGRWASSLEKQAGGSSRRGAGAVQAAVQEAWPLGMRRGPGNADGSPPVKGAHTLCGWVTDSETQPSKGSP